MTPCATCATSTRQAVLHHVAQESTARTTKLRILLQERGDVVSVAGGGQEALQAFQDPALLHQSSACGETGPC